MRHRHSLHLFLPLPLYVKPSNHRSHVPTTNYPQRIIAKQIKFIWNTKSAMLKEIIYLGLVMTIASCKKTGVQPHPCASANPNCSHVPGDIVGSWILESSGGYQAPGGTLSWEAADCDSATIIQFNSDSSFTYNDHFNWRSFGYDKFSMNGQKSFIIYTSDTTINRHLITGEVLNNREIRIHFMGVDGTTDQNYDCNN